MKYRQPVLMDGIRFPSLSKAAQHYNTNIGNLVWAVKHSKNWHGHPIELLEPMSPRKPSHKKQSCPVYCETTGILYGTITEAARAAHADGWTMSLKMSNAGKYIDKDGNVYTRQKPMVTKNHYKDTGPTLLLNRGTYKRKKKEESTAELTLPGIENEPVLSSICRPTIPEKSDEEKACFYIKRLIHKAIDNDDYKKVDTYLSMIEELGGK